jgi:hypothetical protein
MDEKSSFLYTEKASDRERIKELEEKLEPLNKKVL